MSAYSVAFIFLALFSAVAVKAKFTSKRTTRKLLTVPSGSFLDKLGRIRTFQDLYREFRIPKNQQLSFKKKAFEFGHSPIMQPNQPKPGQQKDQVVVGSEVDTSYQARYCQKRKVCVNLPQPVDGSGIHWPYCALVPRCSGCCDASSALKKCTALRNSTRRVDVHYIPYDTSITQRPKQVLVVVHDQCECICRQSASSCNANQVFVSKHCRCECNPRISTTCSARFKWDSIACKCVCKHPARICPRNHKFSRSACKCVCMVQKTCSQGLYFDLKTCTCTTNSVFALQIRGKGIP